MSESYLDGLLDELVPAESRDGWDDVLRRARRSQRRYVLLVAAVAILVLVPGTWAALKAFEGSPAPPPVRRSFDRANRACAKARIAKDFPQAEVQKAHGVLQVETKDGLYDLWAAPATDGGTCYLVAPERDRRAGVQQSITEACIRGHQPPLSVGISATDGLFENGSVRHVVLYGYASGSETTVDVTLRDGRTMTLPVVEHFFLGVPPWPFGIRSVTGRDADGRIVARWNPGN